MKTLRRGDRGPEVELLQGWLSLHGRHVVVDGVFGVATEDAVEAFQAANGLLVDGVAGALTQAALQHKTPEMPAAPKQGLVVPTTEDWIRVECDVHHLQDGGKHGFDRTTLLRPAAERLAAVRAVVKELGGIGITSAGGKRDLSAAVGANRSATSLHYLGRAHDLAMYSMMVDPKDDPYVVTLDDADARLWRVWVRASGAEERTLEAWTYRGEKVTVYGRFADLTRIMADRGFSRIPARAAFFKTVAAGKRNDGSAEAWHAELRTGLVAGVTTYGEELQKGWTAKQLKGSRPWTYAHYVWNGSRFEAPA